MSLVDAPSHPDPAVEPAADGAVRRAVVHRLHTEPPPSSTGGRVALREHLAGLLRDEAPLTSVQKHLAAKGEGEVSLILLLEAGQREIEMRLPGRYAVTPQIASALRAVRGVVQVEMV